MISDGGREELSHQCDRIHGAVSYSTRHIIIQEGTQEMESTVVHILRATCTGVGVGVGVGAGAATVIIIYSFTTSAGISIITAAINIVIIIVIVIVFCILLAVILLLIFRTFFQITIIFNYTTIPSPRHVFDAVSIK